ncbi:hypothetical protein SmphiM6_24 [Sinorhizobium phage phiM6]|nr:hypothetical protein SmphiM6_24 [Sinorhizobium phage phiM6]
MTPLPPVLDKPDADLLKDCKSPVDLGNKELAQEQIEKLWIKDRHSLIICGKEKKALRDFYLERDSLLEMNGDKNGL